MPLNDEEKEQLKGFDDSITLINDWGGRVDHWGSEVTEWMGGVDAWGEQADRRFISLDTRTRDHRDQLNIHERHITALRQLTTTIPVLPLVVGAIVGVLAGLIVSGNTDQSDWWSAGVGLAVGVMLFAVTWFLQASFNSRVVATNPPAPQPVATPVPQAPAAEVPDQTQPMHAQTQQQPAAAMQGP